MGKRPMETFEFDVYVRVRKRIWVSGPPTREAARTILEQSLKSGMSIGTFAKRGDNGHPIETIVDNDFTIVDPKD